MHLIAWFKKLKWINAIINYDRVKDNYETILSAYISLTKEKKILEEKVVDLQRLYNQHRVSSQQAIEDAKDRYRRATGAD